MLGGKSWQDIFLLAGLIDDTLMTHIIHNISGTTITAGTWNRSNANACSVEVVRII